MFNLILITIILMWVPITTIHLCLSTCAAT